MSRGGPSKAKGGERTKPEKRIELGMEKMASGLQELGVDPKVVEVVGILFEGALNEIIANFGGEEAEESEDQDAEDLEEEEELLEDQVSEAIDQIGTSLEEGGVEEDVVSVVKLGFQGAAKSIAAEYSDDEEEEGSDDDDLDDEDDDPEA